MSTPSLLTGKTLGPGVPLTWFFAIGWELKEVQALIDEGVLRKRVDLLKSSYGSERRVFMVEMVDQEDPRTLEDLREWAQARLFVEQAELQGRIDEYEKQNVLWWKNR